MTLFVHFCVPVALLAGGCADVGGAAGIAPELRPHSDPLASFGDGGTDPYRPDANVPEAEPPAVTVDPGPADAEDAGAPGPPPETSHQDVAVEAAIVAWREASASWAPTEGGAPVRDPDTPACARRFANLTVIVPDDDTFRRLCQRCNTHDPSERCARMGRIYACASWDEPATIALDASRASDQRTRDALVIHEAIHHLSICTGTGGDTQHAVTPWWCGGPSCIEGAAWRSLERAGETGP